MSQSILLVDDEPILLKCVRRLLRPLEKKGVIVWTSTSAEEAVELLEKHSIDVVVTDENMVGMSGTELLAWISENSPDTKRIVLTGDISVSIAMRAINHAGVDAYLTKPFNNAELLDAVLSALHSKDRESRVQAIRESILKDLTDKAEEQITHESSTS
ncbi:response regulator [Gimesia fumaroli]|uniref:Hydrogenase transcriptional regulatory protein hupR1 n=1 Tax=Gimesia fumaroli TaxID=2527976 RepID=A0A518IDY3_9PLAN|nr:response regulator [Gimesia fumaroli]QDV51304.1 Hydrogenase transcriptional regulatory protein hupR1 [Gimesia fumaroli]